MNIGECMEYAQKLCDSKSSSERIKSRKELRAAIAATVKAETDHLTRELAEAKARAGSAAASLPDGWVAVPIGVIELCAEIEVEDVHDDNGPGHIVCPACKGSARMKWGRSGRLDSHSDIGHAADCPAVFSRKLLSACPELPKESENE